MKDFVFFIFSSGVFHRHENFKSLEGLESDEVREKSLTRNCMPQKLKNEPYSQQLVEDHILFISSKAQCDSVESVQAWKSKVWE